MPNVPVPHPLRVELASRNLVVWEAKRVKKGEPVTVQIAGPGLAVMPHGWGMTIEEAVDRALRHPAVLQTTPGLVGALARLEQAVHDIGWDLYRKRWTDDLDDDIPF